MPMVGAGIAVSVLVGQYLGAERPEIAERATWSGFHLALVYTLVIAASYLLFPDMYIRLFAAGADPAEFESVFGESMQLLRFVALYAVFDSANILFSAAVKGAGDTRFVMFSMIFISVLALGVSVYVAIVILGFGLLTGWGILTTAIFALGITFFLRFRGGKWKTMRVIESAPLGLPPEAPDEGSPLKAARGEDTL